MATSFFAELLMVSMPTCASLACILSGIDFVLETIARRATTSGVGDVGFIEQGRRSVQRTRSEYVARPSTSLAAETSSIPSPSSCSFTPCSFSWPDDSSASALDVLQRPIEAPHMLDGAARLQVDEDFLRPHQVMGAAAVDQDHRRVRLHSCCHRLEVLSGLRRHRDGRLHDADQRARSRLVVPRLAASRGVGVLRRGRRRRLLLLARLVSSSTWTTTARPPAASLGVVVVGVTAVGALKGEVVGVAAQPALPTSTSSSSTAVLGRLLLVDLLGRLPATATTAARLSALPRSTSLLRRGDEVFLRQELL
ncbi:unnamed protein product [Closterium sp. NIES-54]